MSFEPQPVSMPKTPTFILNLVQLTGRPSLLGSEQVTWRFNSSTNVVAGGNSSGKSLLCSAIRVASFPEQTVDLRRGLAAAGLEGITIVGQSGALRREWHINLSSGELSHRPRSGEEQVRGHTPLDQMLRGDSELPERLPHVVVSGAWPVPDRACLRWAESMHVLPLERELSAWQERLAALTSGSNGEQSFHTVSEELERHEAKIARAEQVRRDLRDAQNRADLVSTELTDIEFQLYVAGAEERELAIKIDLAERATRLEGWASELRGAWQTVEQTREQFADLQERLEAVQQTVRGLPDDAAELARRYDNLEEQARALDEKLSRDEETASMLQDRLREVDAMLAEGPPQELRELEEQLGQKREARHLAEHDLTELSRLRINLLRQRDGLVQVRGERYREFAQLSSEEWQALDEFLSTGEIQTEQASKRNDDAAADAERLRNRIKNEFAGFDQLPADTQQKIERLFTARMHVSAKEAEVIRLQAEATSNDRASVRGGLLTGLTAAGVLGAGIPSAYLLGADVGFFGAVIGGGAGFGLARLLFPAADTELDTNRLKLQTTQNDLASAEQMCTYLESELAALARHSSPEAALNRWSEYLALTNSLREAERVCETISNRDVKPGTQVPALLRRLEIEELRNRVNGYREHSAELERAERAISHHDSEQGAGARTRQIEAIAHRLSEEERALDQEIAARRDEAVSKQAALAAQRTAHVSQLEALGSITQERERLSVLQAELAALDQCCSGILSRIGSATIIEALEERDRLTSALRETKARLSTDHPPQELAARVVVIEEELAQVTDKLQELDPLYAAVGSRIEALDKYQSQLDVAKANIESVVQRRECLTAELHELKLSDLQESARQLQSEESLLAILTELQAKLGELQRSIDAAANMCDGLETEIAEQRERATSRVMGLLKKTVFDSIGERIASVEFHDQEWIAIPDDEQRRPLSALSRGVAELVTLCLNAGLLIASEDGEAAPIVWDDVLAQLDDLHLAIARQIVEQLARKRQVLLMTRDPRIRAWGRPVDVLAGRHEVDVLLN
ncbi:MAG: hypothetical protein IPG71_07715 [bacterium]|nr:hypothetical protein [bacterium]